MKYAFSRVLLFSAALFLTTSSIAQNDFNHTPELSNLVQAPNSPEAQAFAQYGNTSVNMYMGRPNIGVPIYTHKGREMNLPISLSYDASGIKRNELASNVGLGWNLAIGGRISRVVNGMPDEYSLVNGSPYFSYWETGVRSKINAYLDQQNGFNTKSGLTTYLTFLRDVNKGRFDTQPDYFRVNAPGLSEMIVFDINPINNGTPTPRALNNPRLKISVSTSGGGGNSTTQTPADKSIDSWTITLDTGVIYKFEEAEVTRYRNQNIDDANQTTQLFAWDRRYNSSWVLTEIISANKKDTYEFNYESLPEWSEPHFADQGQSISTNVNGGPGGGSSGSPTTTTMDIDYYISQKIMSEVWHNTKRIVSFDKSTRYDISPEAKKVDRINIHKTDPDSAGSLLTSIDLAYDYFKPSDVTDPALASRTKIKLRLTGLSMNNQNASEAQEYGFEYFSNGIAEMGPNKGIDYLGYTNNGNSNAALEGILYPPYIEPNVINLSGGNRNPNFDLTILGSLKKIYYPSGGSTEFEFEPATVRVEDGYALPYYGNETSLSLTATTANTSSLNDQACNATVIGNSDISPSESSTTFSTGNSLVNGEYTGVGTFQILLNTQGSPTSPVIFPANRKAYIIKVPSVNNLYSYQDLYDNNCNLLIDSSLIKWQYTSSWDSQNDSFKKIALEEGTYQLLIVNPFVGTTVNVDINKLVSDSPNYKIVEKAGIKIRQIRDYTDANTLVRKRSYEYPSGRVIFEPSLVKKSLREVFNPDGSIHWDYFIHRYASDYGGDKPHIVYPTVIQRTLDQENEASNGSVVHSYFTGTSLGYQSGVYVNNTTAAIQSSINNYGVDFRLGKSSSSRTVRVDGKTVQSQSQNFDYTQFNEFRAIGLASNLNNTHKFVYYVQGANGKWYYNLVNGVTDLPNGETIGGQVMHPPHTGVYADTPYELFSDTQLAALFFKKTYAHARWGQLTDKTSNVFSEENVLTQKSSYFYYGENPANGSGRASTRDPIITVDPNDPNDDDPDIETTTNYVTGLLSHSMSQDSSEDVVMTKYSYPGNLTTAYSSLISANMLNTPVKTKTFEQDILLGTQRTTFNGTYPESIYTEKGGANTDLEKRMTFSRYSLGVGKNLLEANKEDGTPMTYIWSYDHRYLVAKIENASFDDVKNMLGVTASVLENFPVASIASLNTLRSSLPNSLVTTYTYIPQVGVQTITDPRGYILTYNYDDFHRLKKIVDKDGHVIEKYEYNTKAFNVPNNDNSIPPLVASAVDITIDNTVSPNVTYTSEVFGLSGGVGPYTYKWSRKIGNGSWQNQGTTTTNQYQFSYSINDTNYCDTTPGSAQSSVLIRCLVTDSNGDTVEPQSSPRALVCTNNQQ